MAEEIPVSSSDKEFPDDVAVEEENTSDKDAEGLNESNEFADVVAIKNKIASLYKKASKDRAKMQKLMKERRDLLKQREDLIEGRFLDLHKKIDDLEAKQRALGMALAVGVLALVTLYLFKQK